jgi:acetyl-CoA C-acetyltransferase
MSPPAAVGTCPPRSGTAMRGKLAPECERVHHSVTDVNFISYEDHGFAERFGGFQFGDAEVTNGRGALPVNPSGRSKSQGRALRAVDMAQCAESFTQCRVVVNQLDAARIAMAHNIGGLAALSAGTILEGPTANGS